MHGNINQLVCPSCGVVVIMTPALLRKLRGKKAIPCPKCDCEAVRCRIMLYDDAEGMHPLALHQLCIIAFFWNGLCWDESGFADDWTGLCWDQSGFADDFALACFCGQFKNNSITPEDLFGTMPNHQQGNCLQGWTVNDMVSGILAQSFTASRSQSQLVMFRPFWAL